jgi:hypothetical protein
MKLQVPFFTNSAMDCGPVCLQMVLAYFGEEHTWEELQKLASSYANGTTLTVGLAGTAAKLGFRAEFYTTSVAFNPLNFELPSYQTGELYSDDQTRLVAEAKMHGAHIEERSLSSQELLGKINESCIAIVLVDWRKIQDRPSFLGHFMVLVGYDETFIYFHQPGPKNPEPFFKLTREVFEAARKSKGTDEDIVFIRKK